MANVSEVAEFLSDVLTGNDSASTLRNGTNGTRNGHGSRSLFFSNKEAPNLLAPNFFSFERHVPELPNTISGKIITGLTAYDASFIFLILLVVAYIKDRRIEQQKECIFIPKRPVKGFRKYALLLETGHSPAGGTTSGVFIRLCGRLTKSPAFSLSWRNETTRPLFWSQNKDVFILSVPHYLGHIDSIEVMTSATGKSPPWFLRCIRVMCLDNRKCWKAKAHAWLRGDRKPFSFQASLMGALSTRDYMKKVFLQNHSWTMMWQRKLGSTFTCSQRCSILWISVLGGMFGAHFYMYKWPYSKEAQFDKASGLRIPVEYVIRGDDAVAAGVLGALAGAFLGLFLRALARLTTCTRRWARVDDKDDFTHIMNPEDLVYVDGAVVLAHKPTYNGPKIPPFPPCVDDSVLKILDSLTPQQIEAVKKMIDRPSQFPAANDSKDDQSLSANTNMGGNKNNITHAMTSLWDTAKSGFGILSSGSSGRETPGPSTGIWAKIKHGGAQSRKPRKFTRRAKKSKASVKYNRNQDKTVPNVSARCMDFAKLAACIDMPVDYDSLSEPESDEDVVIKPLRGDQEVNRRRRDQKVYDDAPWWDDRHRVYVSSPEAGDDHFVAVDERYERTAEPITTCCMLRAEAPIGEEAILRYLQEDVDDLGHGVSSSNPITTIICALCLLIAIALAPFIVYERLPLPNAHALYYLYAVILCLLFHGTTFSSADAMMCAVLATCARRGRIALVRCRAPHEDEATAK